MKIVLISCVKQKIGIASKAKDMYVSSLFKGMYSYAKSLNPDKIYILSAKYGLLEENEEIEPYNETLLTKSQQEKEKWSKGVLKSLQDKGCDFANDEFVILAGSVYRKYLVRYFKKYTIPMEGMGIGKQLKFLRNKKDRQLCITFPKN